jgi:hypothetical protein
MEKGGYVVGIAKLTCWDGERDWLDAPKVKTKKEVIAIVQQHAPELAEIVTIELNQSNERDRPSTKGQNNPVLLKS